MRRLLCILISGILASAAWAQKPDGPYVLDEVLVKFREGTSSAMAEQALARTGSAAVESLGKTRWKRVKIGGKLSIDSAIAELGRQREIEFVQPNFYYRLAATPNDTLWPDPGMYGMPKIAAPAAWDLTTGSSEVVVANIDTGMRYTHEDLAANMWANPGEIPGNGVDDDGNGFADDVYGYDFFFNDPDPLDEHGHGTHVGGIIGAVGNNSKGVAGVNWNVRIMAIKIYDSDGFGTTSAMLVNAYDYLRMMKLRGINIRVTNNSYSGCTEACGFDQATKDGIDAMGDAGILNVFAAGNDGWNNDTAVAPAYPAAYTSPSILAVAASTSTDARAGFSNWGVVGVDIAAPGSGVLSTTFSTDSSYGNLSGTSMAAPHVTGAAALLAAYDPSLSVQSIKATLLNTADPLTGWEATPIRTNGRLNVFNALQNRTVCGFGLSTNEVFPITKGGYYYVDVAAPQNCDFAVRSNDRWLRIEGADNRSGSVRVRFRLGVNPRISRSGTLTIAGQTVTVIQSRM